MAREQQPVQGVPTDEANRDMVIGVLALQGSYPLHEDALRRLGVKTRRIRKQGELAGLNGLVIPGGESTVMSQLARDYDLFDELRDAAAAGLAVFGTCAGAILMGECEGEPPTLEAVPVRLTRNAYGRQVDSFTAHVDLSPFSDPFRCVFIRAPTMAPTPADDTVTILGQHEGEPVLLRVGRVLLATFHPELTDDLRLHRYFVTLCAEDPC